MLTFRTDHCQLQSSPVPSLCKGSIVSSTAGTDIRESHVGWSAIVPEFQRHPGNNTLLAAISFSEKRKCHNGQSQ
jgi:hypothetical protein